MNSTKDYLSNLAVKRIYTDWKPGLGPLFLSVPNVGKDRSLRRNSGTYDIRIKVLLYTQICFYIILQRDLSDMRLKKLQQCEQEACELDLRRPATAKGSNERGILQCSNKYAARR